MGNSSEILDVSGQARFTTVPGYFKASTPTMQDLALWNGGSSC